MTAQHAAQLPGGAQLTPGEAPVVAGTFMTSTVGFFLDSELVLTNRRLFAVRPNTLLGIIPVGTSRANYPVENIAGINVGTRFSVGGLLIGLLALLVGLPTLLMGAYSIGLLLSGLALVAIGVGMVASAPRQEFEVMNSGGGLIRFPISVLERKRAVQFANTVSEALARVNSRSPYQPSNPALAGMPEPGDALARLQLLRGQGLISDVEFDTKRREILARI